MNQLVQIASICIFLAVVSCAAIVDHKTNRLPDNLTIPVFFLGFFININSTFVPLYESVLGSIAGYATIRFLHGFQISRQGIAGIGLGDAKFLAALCAWFGWRVIPIFLTGGSAITLAIYPFRTNKPFGVGLGITAIGLLIYHYLPI